MAAQTLDMQARPLASDDRFFLLSAMMMAAVTYGGFAMQLAMGRSTFAVPPIYHLHAVVFMGWVTLFLAQTVFATVGPLASHRRLGWVAAVWVVPMIILGPALTIDRVQAGRVPFFFEPQHFLIANPMTVVAFVGLTAAAIVLRRRTDWHRRLHLCGMTAILGPGVGRLLPLPLMEPLAFQSAMIAGLAFPVAGMLVDLRHGRGVHRAWLWGIGTILIAMLLIEAVARSPVGDALYRIVTQGTPGESIAPMAFAAPPGP